MYRKYFWSYAFITPCIFITLYFVKTIVTSISSIKYAYVNLPDITSKVADSPYTSVQILNEKTFSQKVSVNANNIFSYKNLHVCVDDSYLLSRNRKLKKTFTQPAFRYFTYCRAITHKIVQIRISPKTNSHTQFHDTSMDVCCLSDLTSLGVCYLVITDTTKLEIYCLATALNSTTSLTSFVKIVP